MKYKGYKKRKMTVLLKNDNKKKNYDSFQFYNLIIK